MAKLRISPDLALPTDAVTQTFAIFGKRGSGKSNTGVVLAEELHRAGAPIVVLDPIDAWWGLKAAFDGKGPGLPVYIFGGPHADLPLQPTAGELMAQVFIAHRLPMVLCMKGWTGADRARFVTAFALYLLAHNDRVPVHVFIEEADAFVPQRPYKGEEAMLGAMDRLVRWGRQEGIGATLITQRSAKVNKDVTTQAETLIAHRTVGPQDRDAIDAWIKFHAGDEQRHEVLSTLPTLPDGTAWIWSPEWLGILQQVRVRRRDTYDSAATPKLGEKRPQPKELAAVDVERLRGQLADTIEKAKADDPKELRRRITELEKQLRAEQGKKPQVEIREVETVVEVMPPVVKELAVRINRYRHEFTAAAEEFGAAVDELAAVASGRGVRAGGDLLPRPGGRPAPTPRPSAAPTKEVAPRDVVSSGSAVGGGMYGDAAASSVSGPQQRILDALAWLESVRIPAADRTQLALLSDASHKSSAYANNLGRLRSEALIEYTARGVVLTDAGRALATTPASTPTTADLHRSLFSRLPGPQVRILRALIDAYPDARRRDSLAQETESSPTSSAYANNLGRLRSLGLIDYPDRGHVVALPVLFLEGR